MMKKEIKYTPQGFSYVDVGIFEIINWGGAGICAGCGRGPFRNMKLIYILADTYCDKCFNEWLERQEKYLRSDIEHDIKLQEENDKKFYECYSKYFIERESNER